MDRDKQQGGPFDEEGLPIDVAALGNEPEDRALDGPPRDRAVRRPEEKRGEDPDDRGNLARDIAILAAII